jgi:hypothetical protein
MDNKCRFDRTSAEKDGALLTPLSESKALEDTCHSQDRLQLFTSWRFQQLMLRTSVIQTRGSHAY